MTSALVTVVPLMLAASGGKNCLTDLEKLGRHIFFDEELSEPAGQSCAACHGPRVGFTGPHSAVNATTAVYEGAVPGRFGNRKPPSAAYATSAPVFHLDPDKALFVGGNFWDGRATGELLGSPAADQAQGPFLNPLEQNNPDAAAVVDKVCGGAYAPLFLKVWGADACADVPSAYDRIARSIAAYEGSLEVSAFSSRWDAWRAGEPALTEEELRGAALFEGKAGCAACHTPPLFTDHSFDNAGLPRNPQNPFYLEAEWNPDGAAWIDPGLAGFLATRPEWSELAPSQLGKHKVPTLRNVDRRPSPRFVKAFGHNGCFKTLEGVVHFYNTRDVLPVCPAAGGEPGVTCWPAPEVPENVNRTELGDLVLTRAEEAELVAFLRTLSDGYLPVCR
jgi:cytochrome c peroxidase